jgi:hypothetical protein
LVLLRQLTKQLSGTSSVRRKLAWSFCGTQLTGAPAQAIVTTEAFPINKYTNDFPTEQLQVDHFLVVLRLP